MPKRACSLRPQDKVWDSASSKTPPISHSHPIDQAPAPPWRSVASFLQVYPSQSITPKGSRQKAPSKAQPGQTSKAQPVKKQPLMPHAAQKKKTQKQRPHGEKMMVKTPISCYIFSFFRGLRAFKLNKCSCLRNANLERSGDFCRRIFCCIPAV